MFLDCPRCDDEYPEKTDNYSLLDGFHLSRQGAMFDVLRIYCGEILMKVSSLITYLLFGVVLPLACEGNSESTNGNGRLPPALQIAFGGLTVTRPVDLQHAGDGTNRVFIVSQPGTIYVTPTTASVPSGKIFLDISGRVLDGGEQGLLGLAFHPQYSTNGYFFVNYTAESPRRTIVSRFRVSMTNPDSADASTELRIIEFDQPYANHNGGQVTFGPDGFLYIATGDGGSGGDPQNNAQNKRALLGKILRIDVNATSGGRNYAIPSTNPFYQNDSLYSEEIYAYGLRNPWRISFDSMTGRLWAADVGQDVWEEVDIIELGMNYGWRITEGMHCYSPSSNCSLSGLTLPVWEYRHSSSDGCSITGGYVYRGSGSPSLQAKYILGDYCSGRVWALSYDGINPASAEVLLDTRLAISSFGSDKNGELYICSHVDGKIYSLTSSP